MTIPLDPRPYWSGLGDNQCHARLSCKEPIVHHDVLDHNPYCYVHAVDRYGWMHQALRGIMNNNFHNPSMMLAAAATYYLLNNPDKRNDELTLPCPLSTPGEYVVEFINIGIARKEQATK